MTIYIEDMVEGLEICTPMWVARSRRARTRSGRDYLTVTLGDRSGQIEGKLWQDLDRSAPLLAPDAVALISGSVVTWEGRLQLEISAVQPAPQELDPRDFLPQSRFNAEAMMRQLEDVLRVEIASVQLRRFVDALLATPRLRQGLLLAPAATRNHHNYLGGLLEHTLSMTRLAVSMCRHYAHYYPGLVHSDMVLVGCLLHDIGKIDELHYDATMSYSTEGRLLGHIVRGVELINEIAATMDPAPPRSMLTQLKHLVLAHHGKLEYGSPTRPQTPEALLLHEIDMIDSRMNMVWAAQQEHQGGWTPYQKLFESRLYFGDDDESWRESRPLLEHHDLVGPGIKRKPYAGADLERKRGRQRGFQSPATAHNKEAACNLDLFGDV